MAKKSNSNQAVLAFVDRIESDYAAIILSEATDIQFNFPRQYLPANIVAGDHLKITFELDPKNTEGARDRIAALQAELTKENESETNIKL